MIICKFCFSAGPVLGSSPVKSIVQCLARKEGTDDFYILKVHIYQCNYYFIVANKHLLVLSNCCKKYFTLAFLAATISPTNATSNPFNFFFMSMMSKN